MTDTKIDQQDQIQFLEKLRQLPADIIQRIHFSGWKEVAHTLLDKLLEITKKA